MFRKTISFLAFWSFLALSITGIVLFIIPQGRIAYWADLHILGLDKTQWGNLHITFSALFLITGSLHIYLNWKALLYYLKNKAQMITFATPPFLSATVIFLLFFIGTYYEVSPFKDLIKLGDTIKESWKDKVGEPPYPHAELSKIGQLAKKEGMEKEIIIQILKDNNIIFNENDNLLTIARKNNTTPSKLFEFIESKYTEYETKK
ncbi:MAG: DUF4405 domain-containing protein [Calditerrivibrio sp.]|nr:DUF4405 domain-containing protein [Calditerrivibrio sp.]